MGKIYTTSQGDMWDSIAYSQLGSTDHTDKLMNANQQYREFYIFPADIVLNLPEIQENVSSLLPPWKRVKHEQ